MKKLDIIIDNQNGITLQNDAVGCYYTCHDALTAFVDYEKAKSGKISFPIDFEGCSEGYFVDMYPDGFLCTDGYRIGTANDIAEISRRYEQFS